MKDLISVVLPVFNGSKYIGDAINSIVNQSYDNLEIIIVNDGSTDNSIEIIRSFNDDRIIIIDKEVNEGLVCALNDGILLSKGDFIARMDSDDVMLKDRIEYQLNHIKMQKADVVFSNAISLGNRIKRRISSKLLDIEIPFLLLVENPLIHPTMFCKGDLLRSNLYTKRYEYSEDYYLWTQLIIRDCKISYSDYSTIFYRLHGQQITKRKSDEVSVKTRSSQKEYWLNLCGEEMPESYVQQYNTISNKLCSKSRVLFFLKLYLDSEFSKEFKLVAISDKSQYICLVNILLYSLFRLDIVKSQFWRIRELLGRF
ncbi:glycosyltransferase family 2 protein [Shewanella glacialipiscicola]|uniref:glycosyltransferase family 2 protein n=1 Tax=Shewanella glacialipiscicola TaxID=614069 RepID=UPI003D7A26CB